MGVKLNEEDMEYVKEIYQAITKTLSKMPPEFMSSNKFGSWTVNALINLLCSLFRIMALNKNDLLKAVEDVWDKYEELYKKILN